MNELIINGGNLSFWGEYFGRPHDNFHRIETVRWEKDRILIHFTEGESLYVTDPIGILNNEHEFAIQNATKVLWVRYCYGKERSYENMFVRQYEKDDNGMIIRAEGKCSLVKEGYGLPFPYTESDAQWWLNMVQQKDGNDGIFRVIVINGEYVGNITVEKKNDVRCKDAECPQF